MKGVLLKEGELAYLIKESTGKAPVAMSFGPAGTWTNDRTPKWCIDMLVRMRYETNEDGGGI